MGSNIEPEAVGNDDPAEILLRKIEVLSGIGPKSMYKSIFYCDAVVVKHQYNLRIFKQKS